jgi:hypothetical protein
MRLAIGDIHGRTFWKNYLDKDFSEYYILGDYFDSFDVPFAQQMRNFADIVQAAEKDRRIKLCLGNHDYHYLVNNQYEQYSGFQDSHAIDIQEALLNAGGLLNIVYETNDKIILSHAGFSRTFMTQNDFVSPTETNTRFKELLELGPQLADMPETFLSFNGSELHGDDITQGPLWIRPASLARNAIAGFSQIVGHTPVRHITTIPLPKSQCSITLIDTHDCESVYWF